MLLRDKENEDWKAAAGQDGTVINLQIWGDRKETNKSGTGFKDQEVTDNFGKDQVEGEDKARLQWWRNKYEMAEGVDDWEI